MRWKELSDDQFSEAVKANAQILTRANGWIKGSSLTPEPVEPGSAPKGTRG